MMQALHTNGYFYGSTVLAWNKYATVFQNAELFTPTAVRNPTFHLSVKLPTALWCQCEKYGVLLLRDQLIISHSAVVCCDEG
jgi:hypothetical protein